MDPTGAGDSFAGGFIGYLARTGDSSEATLRRAVILGSVMASLNVEDFSLRRLMRQMEAALNVIRQTARALDCDDPNLLSQCRHFAICPRANLTRVTVLKKNRRAAVGSSEEILQLLLIVKLDKGHKVRSSS